MELPIDIFSDSTGARAIAKNNVFHKRTKHINIKFHFIREKITDGTLHVNEVASEDNLAAIHKHATRLPHFNHLHNMLGYVYKGRLG